MSKDLYKAQAARLADHLTAKHGIKLKPASLLEIVASVHGARDWNTLAAGMPLAPELISKPTVPAENTLNELSASDRLLHSILTSGASQFKFFPPSERRASTQGLITYEVDGIQTRVSLKAERSDEFRARLLELANLGPAEAPVAHWSHNEFTRTVAGQTVAGSIRQMNVKMGEEFLVEWGRGASFTRRAESLPKIDDLVAHFAKPQAHGMYLVASLNSASGRLVTEAIASRVPGRKYAETHDFETEYDRSWMRHDLDVAMGELRTPEGLSNLVSILDSGALALTRVHAHGIEGALRRAEQVGLTRSDLRQHLQGVLALTSLRTVCTRCDGKGCSTCKNNGIGGIVHLYEYMLLDNVKDYENMAVDKSWGPSLEQQARALVAQGRVSLGEAQRVFGPEFQITRG